MRIVECVPNFSEGRRPEIVEKIREAIAAVDGIAVLDVSSDASHNRTVITFVAPIEPLRRKPPRPVGVML
jgi:glutamate formiminotransferase